MATRQMAAAGTAAARMHSVRTARLGGYGLAFLLMTSAVVSLISIMTGKENVC
jgi:hypothetical protein